MKKLFVALCICTFAINVNNSNANPKIASFYEATIAQDSAQYNIKEAGKLLVVLINNDVKLKNDLICGNPAQVLAATQCLFQYIFNNYYDAICLFYFPLSPTTVGFNNSESFINVVYLLMASIYIHFGIDPEANLQNATAEQSTTLQKAANIDTRFPQIRIMFSAWGLGN